MVTSVDQKGPSASGASLCLSALLVVQRLQLRAGNRGNLFCYGSYVFQLSDIYMACSYSHDYTKQE